jgi:hypothetical protein
MFHVTAFAGTTGDMTPAGFTSLTIFGGAELRRPTLAAILLDEKQRRRREPGRWERWLGRDENLVITLFGGTSLIPPTAVEEFTALSGMLRSGSLEPGEIRATLDAQPQLGARRSLCRTLTLFGSCATEDPDLQQERRALDALAADGALPDAARRGLEALLGTSAETRSRLIAELVLAAG